MRIIYTSYMENKCTCGEVFGAPATLRIHVNNKHAGKMPSVDKIIEKAEKVISKVKKVIKDKNK